MSHTPFDVRAVIAAQIYLELLSPSSDVRTCHGKPLPPRTDIAMLHAWRLADEICAIGERHEQAKSVATTQAI